MKTITCDICGHFINPKGDIFALSGFETDFDNHYYKTERNFSYREVCPSCYFRIEELLKEIKE